jgi:hypothetical protein
MGRQDDIPEEGQVTTDQLLAAIRSLPGMTADQYCIYFARNVRHHLAKLLADGRIVRVAPHRNDGPKNLPHRYWISQEHV